MTSTAIAIRTTTLDDTDTLSALLAASYATLDPSFYDAAALERAMPAMSRVNPKLLSSGSYYVAEIGNEAACCGGWTPDEPGTGQRFDGVAHVRHFATHPSHTRKGLARLVLAYCLEQARLAGFQTIRTQATFPAEPFYAGSGFRRTGLVTVEFGPGIFLPAVAMERPL